MAAKKGNTEPKTVTISGDEYNELEIILEQIAGLTDLIRDHAHVEGDAGTMTALNLIVDRSEKASELLGAAQRRRTASGASAEQLSEGARHG